MKQAILLITCVVLFSVNSSAQDSAQIKKTNPIIYAEVVLGYARTKIGYLEAGAAVNYQFKKNLLTVRSTIIFSFNPDQYQEHAVLYGRRYIKGERSLSYSLGASWNRTDLYDYSTFNTTKKKDVFLGVPFELNIKWFDEKKEKATILSYFPFGKQIAFGGGAGFKIQGNISKHSYVALGLVIGFGFHKQY